MSFGHISLAGRSEEGREPRVYLAGKIGQTDWRHSLFPTIRNAELLQYQKQADRVVLNGKAPVRDGFVYGGPFFLTDDHGCFHGEGQHGLIDPGHADGPGNADMSLPNPLGRKTVAQSCLGWINEADVIFAWLDEHDAYGTLFELGFASSVGKPIFLAGPLGPGAQPPSFWQDVWFARFAVSEVVLTRSSDEAWGQFVDWWGKRQSPSAG